MKARHKKILSKSVRIVLSVFLLMNIVAALHAWRFTHFTDSQAKRETKPDELSIGKKLGIALSGIPNPRPVTRHTPDVPFEAVTLQSNVKLSCWYMKADHAIGTVLLFHGYGGEKSGMLDKAAILLKEGYDVFIPDFMGGGQSQGNTTTIGYREAENVKTCYDYVRAQSSLPVFLFGTSMGAVAIMKYLADHPNDKQPSGILLECPFGTMYETVCARFKMVGAPTFPMAGLLVFWGGLENGFWAYDHNPRDYATSIKCPTLLIFGEKDDRVTMKETRDIFNNLSGTKTLKTYPEAGHNNYLIQYRDAWTADVSGFLSINNH